MTLTITREKAGRWFRVSDDSQDEESQFPDVDGWCDSHDYLTSEATAYTVHGKSAFKGNKKFDAMWAKVIDDIRMHKITVLVVWKLDRMDRKLQTFQMIAEVVEAGGRVEFATEPHLNDLSTMAGRISLKIAEEMAYQESKTKSDRVLIKLEALRAAGSVIGKPSWGLRIECKGHPEMHDAKRCKHIKLLVPTSEGRRWIPVIFKWVIDGKPLVMIAQALDKAGVRTMSGKPWNEQWIANRLIKNPVYYGRRRNSGQLEVEPLVSVTIWQEADAVLNGRKKQGRGTTVHEKVLFNPTCARCYGEQRDGCPDGKSPMYRVLSGTGNQYQYHRCTGSGPQRKGCGAPLIPLDELEQEVEDFFCQDTEAHWERVFVPGDTTADEIARLRESGADAMRKGDMEAVMDIMTQVRELEAQPRTEPHWEEVKSELSEAEYFMSLDRDERREYLSHFEIIAALGRPVIVRQR